MEKRDLKTFMKFFKEIEYNSWFRKKLLMFFALIIVIVSVLEIWAVNRLATFGSEISKLELAKNSLQMENEILENKIAEKSSLLKIEENSKIFGFKKITKLEYFQTQNIAFKR